MTKFYKTHTVYLGLPEINTTRDITSNFREYFGIKFLHPTHILEMAVLEIHRKKFGKLEDGVYKLTYWTRFGFAHAYKLEIMNS